MVEYKLKFPPSLIPLHPPYYWEIIKVRNRRECLQWEMPSIEYVSCTVLYIFVQFIKFYFIHTISCGEESEMCLRRMFIIAAICFLNCYPIGCNVRWKNAMLFSYGYINALNCSWWEALLDQYDILSIFCANLLSLLFPSQPWLE